MNNIMLNLLVSLFFLQGQLAACQGFRQMSYMVIVRYFSREIVKTCAQNQSKDAFKNKKESRSFLEIYHEINGPLRDLPKNSQLIVREDKKNNRKIK